MTWSVTGNEAPAPASSANALDTVIKTFEVLDVVVADSAATIDAVCPASVMSAPEDSYKVMVVCGKNHGNAALTPTSGASSLTGTFLQSSGTFASGSIAASSASSRVLANYSNAQVTTTAGSGLGVTAVIGLSGSTSPSKILTGYSVTTDSSAPDTTITGGTADGATITTTETASYTFTSTETGSTFQCSMTTGADSYSSCTSPKSFSSLPPGSYAFKVKSTDPAGNTDSSPATRTLTVALADSTAPSVSISAVSDSLLNASETTTDLTWSANEAGTYAIKHGGTSCADATAVTGTNVSGSYVSGSVVSIINASSLTDNASNTVRVCVTDASNNVGQDTTTITRDSIPPSGSPSTPDLDALSDTGSSNTDDITSDTTPTFTGTGTTGEIVEILVDGTVKGSGTVSGGSYSITTSTLSEGSHSVKARYTDAAGNKGTDSATLTITVDTTSNAPAITGSTPSSPANDNNPKINGTAEAGSTVTLYTTSDCTGTVAGTDTATGGNFSVAVSVTDNTSTAYWATATDTAGNVSACSTDFSYTEDSTAPSAPAITGSTPSSPANDNNPKINGTAEAGSTVTLYTTSDCTGTVAGTDTATGGNFSVAVSVTDNTSTAYWATATDTAGNVSACSTDFSYTEDSTAPSVSSITRADANPTAADTVQFTVTFSEPVVTVATTDFDLDASGVGATISDVTGSGQSRTVTVSSVTGDGSLSIYVNDGNGSIKDGAGNPLSPATFTTGEAYTIDNSAPGVSLINPADGSTVSDLTPAFSGSGAVTDNATVTVKIFSGSSVPSNGTTGLVQTLSTTRDAVDGTYSVDSPALTDNQTYTAQAYQSDAVGNIGASSANTFTVIDPITFISAGPGDDSTVYHDGVSFSFTASVSGAMFQCSLVASGSADAFTSCSSPKAYTGLTNGQYTFKVRAIDAGGNVDPTPATVDFTVSADTAAPATGGGGTAGSATTDSDGEPGATPSDPVETSVSVPASAAAGPITISESPAITNSPSGWVLFGQEISISAPAASSPDEPLELVFAIDASAIPTGVEAADIRIFRNGAVLGDCVSAGIANPDPCQLTPAISGDDVVITIYTTQASVWNIGVAQAFQDRPSDTTPPKVEARASTEVISPNGDGRLDEVSVDVDFSEQVEWTLEVVEATTVVADGSVSGSRVQGSDVALFETTGSGTQAQIVWDGMSNDRTALPEGAYVWRITASDPSGNIASPLSAAIRIDRTAPVVLGLKARPSPFDVDRDRKTRIRFKVSEKAVVRVKILRKGRVRKTFDAVQVTDPTAAVRLTWWGRNDAGNLIRPGRYVVKIKAVDAGKNTVVNSGLRLKVA